MPQAVLLRQVATTSSAHPAHHHHTTPTQAQSYYPLLLNPFPTATFLLDHRQVSMGHLRITTLIRPLHFTMAPLPLPLAAVAATAVVVEVVQSQQALMNILV